MNSGKKTLRVLVNERREMQDKIQEELPRQAVEKLGDNGSVKDDI